jgi:phage-related protein
MVDIVGSAGLSIFPVMKGFKGAVSKEAKAAGRSSASSVSAGFSGKSVGSELGKDLSAGFKSSSSGLADSGLGRLKTDVAAASNALSKARLKQADTAGKVREAEAKLTEALAKYPAGSSQVVAAEERLASARRRNEVAVQAVTTATGKLTTAQRSLRMVEEQAAAATAKSTSGFRTMASSFKAGFQSISRGQSSFTGLSGALGSLTRSLLPVTTVSNLVGKAVSTIGPVVGKVGVSIKSGLSTAATATAGFATKVGSDIIKPFQSVGGKISTLLSPIASKVGPKLAPIGTAAKAVFDKLPGFAKSAAASTESALTSMAARVKSGFSSIGAGIKGLATVGVGAAAAGIAALGPAFVSTSKAALSAYSTYEQAVGGVDTLFKSSSKQVQGYAKNAYASAGVSANDYMSQVTSFSATMISALGGDTAKAAKLSDQAIIDMSDNANKMGTDLDSVQQTYQSIARGNYAMLDNLKLGYGGTKTEMQRLLKDAQKLTGVKYDINNFADVTQAIHAVQSELGITGTTAKEASSTIEGSMASMKASWTNWLTELGKSDADMSGLTTQLVGSIGTALKNVLPRIGVIAKSVVSALPSLFSQLVTLLPAPFQKAFDAVGRTVGGMKNVFAPLAAVLGVLGASGLGPLLTKLPVVGKLLGSVAGSGTLLGKALGVLTGPFGMIIAAIGALIATTPSLREAFGGEMQLVFASVGAAVTKLQPTFQMLVTTLSGAFSRLMPVITDTIGQLIPVIGAILNAVTPLIPAVLEPLMQMIQVLIPPLTNIITSILPPLTALIVGLLPTISQIIGVIVQIATTLTSALVPIISQLGPLITSVIQMIVPVINALIPVILQIVQVFANVFAAVSPILAGLMALIGGIVGQIVDFIQAVVVPVVQGMIPVVTSVINTIGTVINAIVRVVSGVVNVIAGIFSGDWSRVWKGFGQIASGAIDGLKGIVSGIGNIGANLVKGLWNGISNLGGWIKDKIFGFARGITDSIKRFFGIHSPSKLWADEIGRFLPPGIAVGVEKSAPQLYDSVTTMGEKATDLASMAANKVRAGVLATTTTQKTAAPAGTTSATRTVTFQNHYDMHGITDPDVMAAAIHEKEIALASTRGAL